MITYSANTAIATSVKNAPSWTGTAVSLNHKNLTPEQIAKLKPIFTETVIKAFSGSTRIKLNRALKLIISTSPSTAIGHNELGHQTAMPTTLDVDTNNEETESVLIEIETKGAINLKHIVATAFEKVGIDKTTISYGVVVNRPKFMGSNIFDIANNELLTFQAIAIAPYRSNRLIGSDICHQILNAYNDASFTLSMTARTPTWLAISSQSNSSPLGSVIGSALNEEVAKIGNTEVDPIALNFQDNSNVRTATITTTPLDIIKKISNEPSSKPV